MKKLQQENYNMAISKNKIEELIKAAQTKDIYEMMIKYKEMVKDWAAYVSLKLNNDYINCPITLYNEVHNVNQRLKLINEYQAYIEYCAILQGIIDEELE